MKKKFLEENGTLISEQDFYNNGIYAGTEYFYLYKEDLYRSYSPKNAFTYSGEPYTELYLRKEEMKEELVDSEYAYMRHGIFKETYKEICKAVGIEPNMIDF